MSFLNKKINNSEEHYLGIDFSDPSLKFLQLEKKNGKDQVRSYICLDVPATCFSDRHIEDKEQIARLIKEALKKASPEKIRTRKVICSLPESKIFLRIISIPKMEQKEIGEAIKWEIEASIPLSIDQIYYDWQLLDEKDEKQSILTVAVAREAADEILEVLELANLEVCALESESMALARSLIDRKSQAGEAILIVDLGAKMTNFIVTQNDIPFFTSSIPFSSEGVTDAIAKSLGVDKDQAQKIKFSQGLGKISGESAILNSIQAYLESLAVEIEKSIDFYQNLNEKDGVKIKKIIICGGGANLKGLLAYLTKRLDRTVSVGDAWVNLNFEHSLPIINKERSLQFATAIGLAMKKSVGGGINLLPPAKKEAILEAKKLKTIFGWEAVIIFIALCFFGFLFALSSLLDFNLALISGMKNNEADGAKYAKIEEYQNKFSQINTQLNRLSKIDSDQLYWSSALLALDSAVPDEVEITEITTKDLILSLSGHAATRDNLLAFRDELSRNDCFSNIDLPVSELVSKDNVDFQMKLTINEKCLRK